MKPGVHRTVCISHVRDVSRNFKGILLDQFGVLHDGKTAYPEAIEAVQQWSSMGLKVYILSNSSRRSAVALEKISKLGFPKTCFAGAMTSGEVTHRFLQSRPSQKWKQLGMKCLHFTWGSRGAVDIRSLGLSVVTEPAECEFILAHGTEGIGQPDGDVRQCSKAEMEALMDKCAQLGNRPMVIANPDIVTVSGSNLIPMPGSLGQYYSSKGGAVDIMGKPDPIIYQLALDDIALSSSDVLAVGDSIEHDIAGAHAQKVTSLFIAGGIHAKEFGDRSGKVEVTGAAVDRFARSGAFDASEPPACCMDYLRW